MSRHLFPLLLALAACGVPESEPDDAADDDGAATEGMPDPGGSTGGTDDGAPGQCGDSAGVVPLYEPPGACFNNAMCDSCNCRTYRDTPPDAMATCIDAQDEAMMITATVLSFPSGEALPGIDVRVVNALDIVTTGAANATAIAEVVADAQGRIAVGLSEPPLDQVGIIAITSGDGYRETATGLAKPPYEAANAIHDLYVVPQAQLTEYSDALMADAEVASFLPLGNEGGVVGIARNRYTGEPVAGATIESKTNGTQTGAVVRYHQPDGSFTEDATSETGVYVIVNPGLAEEFEARLDGAIVSTRANKAGSGAPGVFTMNLAIDVDPGYDPFAPE